MHGAGVLGPVCLPRWTKEGPHATLHQHMPHCLLMKGLSEVVADISFDRYTCHIGSRYRPEDDEQRHAERGHRRGGAFTAEGAGSDTQGCEHDTDSNMMLRGAARRYRTIPMPVSERGRALIS
jgi:hypothetical protein